MTFHPRMSYQRDFHKSERELPDPGDGFTFTPERRAKLEEIAKRYPPERRRSAVMPALYLARSSRATSRRARCGTWPRS